MCRTRWRSAIPKLLRRCLQKDPRERLRDIGDARLQLQEALAEPQDAVAVAVTRARLSTVLIALLFALTATVGALSWILFARQRPVGEARVVRFSVAPPAGTQFMLGFPASAVSPDGSRLVLVLERNRETYLALRPIDGFELTKIPGTEGATRPFFSPDGKWVAFTAQQPDGKWIAYASDQGGRLEVYVRRFPATEAVWKVSSDGGSSPHWRQDGRELYYSGTQRPTIMAVPIKLGAEFESGAPTVLFTAPREFFDFQATRDGQRFLLAQSADDSPGPVTVILNWPALLGKK